MMTERAFVRAWLLSAAVLAVCIIPIAFWQTRLAAGMLAGGLWNLASAWCLVTILSAWLGPSPSTKRAVAWLVVKLAVLYPLAWYLLTTGFFSPISFGVGFTLVLVSLLGAFALGMRRTAFGRSHGQ